MMNFMYLILDILIQKRRYKKCKEIEIIQESKEAGL